MISGKLLWSLWDLGITIFLIHFFHARVFMITNCTCIGVCKCCHASVLSLSGKHVLEFIWDEDKETNGNECWNEFQINWRKMNKGVTK